MKKLLLFFLIICSLTLLSCSREPDGRDIKFDSGIYHYKTWKNPEVALEPSNTVPDSATAVKIAQAVIDAWPNGEELVPSYVFYDVEDEVWIVTFFCNKPNVLDGGTHIAIRKSDGKILGTWI